MKASNLKASAPLHKRRQYCRCWILYVYNYFVCRHWTFLILAPEATSQSNYSYVTRSLSHPGGFGSLAATQVIMASCLLWWLPLDWAFERHHLIFQMFEIHACSTLPTPTPHTYELLYYPDIKQYSRAKYPDVERVSCAKNFYCCWT